MDGSDKQDGCPDSRSYRRSFRIYPHLDISDKPVECPLSDMICKHCSIRYKKPNRDRRLLEFAA